MKDQALDLSKILTEDELSINKVGGLLNKSLIIRKVWHQKLVIHQLIIGTI